MDEELANVAVELNEIFDNMSSDMIVKIPREIFAYYSNIASKTYKFEYDSSKSLKDQNLSDKTKEVLVELYDKFIYDSEEELRLNTIDEKEKRKKYNPDNIFKDNNFNKSNDSNSSDPFIDSITYDKSDYDSNDKVSASIATENSKNPTTDEKSLVEENLDENANIFRKLIAFIKRIFSS